MKKTGATPSRSDRNMEADMHYSSAREAAFLEDVDKNLAEMRSLKAFILRAAPPSKLKRMVPAIDEIEAHLLDLRKHCLRNLRGDTLRP